MEALMTGRTAAKLSNRGTRSATVSASVNSVLMIDDKVNIFS
jgi:hypothetical protein